MEIWSRFYYYTWDNTVRKNHPEVYKMKNPFFNGFKKGMNNFGLLMTTLVNTLLLSIIYLLGVGITSLFAKLKGKNFLKLKKNDGDSYWQDLDLKKKDIKNYYKQF